MHCFILTGVPVLKPDSLHANIRNFIDCCKQLFGHQTKSESLVSDLYTNVKDTDNFALFHLTSSETKLSCKKYHSGTSWYRYSAGPNKKVPSSVKLEMEVGRNQHRNSPPSSLRSRSKNLPCDDLENRRLTRSRAKQGCANPLAFLHEKFNKVRKLRSKGRLVPSYFLSEVEKGAKTRWLETKEYFTNKCRNVVTSLSFIFSEIVNFIAMLFLKDFILLLFLLPLYPFHHIGMSVRLVS